MECNIERNKADCPCTWPSCSRNGKCCDCLKHHWRVKELPACLFPPEIEKTYDRSLRTFINYWKNKV